MDGAPAMLTAARSRLGDLPQLRFVESAFDAITDGRTTLGPFESIVSSFAIHHLSQAERAALFFRLKEQLAPGGWFLNVDTVLPDESVFTDWQYELWREWVMETENHRSRAYSLREIPDEARRNLDNKLTRLASQLNALRRAGFDALWCVPASPYASMDGALKAIQFAREHGVPFLGTCGGFQHVLIEYARNVLGLRDAEHEEISPDAASLLVCRLTTPLVEREGRVWLPEGSRLRKLLGRDSTTEMYHCMFGLNRAHEAMLDDGKLRVSARDDTGGVHAVELLEHPFFMATLFQPERQALQDQPHPLIRAFVQAALVHHGRGVET